MQVPFLAVVPAEDRVALDAAIQRVVDRGWYVLGPEVEAFEAEFAAACGARFAVGVNSGTDAITLALRALGIGPGDEVIAPAMTAAFTALAIRLSGATPVFADIDPERTTLDAAAVAAAVTPRTRAIVPVHLYGQPADMTALASVAQRHHLAIVEDCAQAHLATADGRPVGTIGVAGAFSFYPTKNLGALGDAGAVVTSDAGLAERMRRLRNGGQAARGHHVDAGVNSRLDEIQAAVLRARLPLLAGWTARRRAHAARYRTALAAADVSVPREADPGHVYHLFAVRSRSRDRLQAHLAGAGVGTLVHYPVPLHRQPAFADLSPATCPCAEQLASETLSLPLYPGLSNDAIDAVVAAVRSFEAVTHG